MSGKDRFDQNRAKEVPGRQLARLSWPEALGVGTLWARRGCYLEDLHPKLQHTPPALNPMLQALSRYNKMTLVNAVVP